MFGGAYRFVGRGDHPQRPGTAFEPRVAVLEPNRGQISRHAARYGFNRTHEMKTNIRTGRRLLGPKIDQYHSGAFGNSIGHDLNIRVWSPYVPVRSELVRSTFLCGGANLWKSGVHCGQMLWDT